MENRIFELKKLKELIEKERTWKPIKPMALSKIMRFIKGHEKPNRQLLDKLSLFVGFQNWQSFVDAMHGDAEANANLMIDDEDKDTKKETIQH